MAADTNPKTDTPTAAAPALPAWAEDLRRRYLRGEASMFVLHGNVFDTVLYRGASLSLSDFLAGPLLAETKETIVSFALVEVRSKEEVIELSRRFWALVGDGEGDIRQVYGPEE